MTPTCAVCKGPTHSTTAKVCSKCKRLEVIKRLTETDAMRPMRKLGLFARLMIWLNDNWR